MPLFAELAENDLRKWDQIPFGKSCAGLSPLNGLLSLFGCAAAPLGSYQRPRAIDRLTLGRGPAMSGVAIFGLAVLSAWLAINIALVVVAVIAGRR